MNDEQAEAAREKIREAYKGDPITTRFALAIFDGKSKGDVVWVGEKG